MANRNEGPKIYIFYPLYHPVHDPLKRCVSTTQSFGWKVSVRTCREESQFKIMNLGSSIRQQRNAHYDNQPRAPILRSGIIPYFIVQQHAPYSGNKHPALEAETFRNQSADLEQWRQEECKLDKRLLRLTWGMQPNNQGR